MIVLSCFAYYIKCNNFIFWDEILFLILGYLFTPMINSAIDLTDTCYWQDDLRKLLRGKVISKKDRIRISFAYLFRIKVDGKYLLVLNERGTNKYQPVGGAYKFCDKEKKVLFNEYNVIDDDNIPIDKSSRNDYRLKVEAKNLKKFIKRFDITKNRESVVNLKREFIEELIKTEILSFKKIKYQYRGRYIKHIEYSKYFKCYELLLADIVELELSLEQEEEIRVLMQNKSEKYLFASSNEVETCGVKKGTQNLIENISDHSLKILQENDENLQKAIHQYKYFTVAIE